MKIPIKKFCIHELQLFATPPPPPPPPNKNAILLLIYMALGYWIGRNRHN